MIRAHTLSGFARADPRILGVHTPMSTRLLGGLAACAAALLFTFVLTSNLTAAQRGASPAAAPGTVVGKVTFDGKAPRPRVIRMGSDPLCMTESKAGTLSEVLLVGPGNGLGDVVFAQFLPLRAQGRDSRGR